MTRRLQTPRFGSNDLRQILASRKQPRRNEEITNLSIHFDYTQDDEELLRVQDMQKRLDAAMGWTFRTDETHRAMHP